MKPTLETLIDRDRTSFHNGADLGAIERRARRQAANRTRTRVAAATIGVVVILTGGFAAVGRRSESTIVDSAADQTSVSAVTVTAFFDGLRVGDDDTTRRYIESGRNLDVVDGNGFPAVIIAAVQNDTDLLRLLLENGANPNLENELGETALHVAARWGQTEMAELLVANGADPDASVRERDARTPLMVASKHGHIEVIEVLVDANADLDQLDDRRRSALVYAIEAKDPIAVRALIDGGADPSIETSVGPLADHATVWEIEEVADLLDPP